MDVPVRDVNYYAEATAMLWGVTEAVSRAFRNVDSCTQDDENKQLIVEMAKLMAEAVRVERLVTAKHKRIEAEYVRQSRSRQESDGK